MKNDDEFKQASWKISFKRSHYCNECLSDDVITYEYIFEKFQIPKKKRKYFKDNFTMNELLTWTWKWDKFVPNTLITLDYENTRY